jgi:nucleoid-associated protein YejK
MRNPGTVELGDVIVHMLNPRNGGLVTSQRTLPMSDELKTYFATHIRNSLEDGSAKAATFRGIDEEDVSGVCHGLLEGSIDLVSGSQELARRLYAIMSRDRRISAGDLVVCFYEAANYAGVRYLGLLKIDPSQVFRHTTKTDEEGRKYVGFEVETEAMPTVRERLQKCAFVRPLDPRPDYDTLLLDRQAGVEREVAKFFADDFLGADLAFDARMRTRIFYRSAVSARNQLYPERISEQEQAKLDDAIRTAMASKRINVDTWTDGLPLPPAAKSRVTALMTKNLPDKVFDVDEAIGESLTRKRRFQGDSGLKLEVPTDAYEQVIESVKYVKGTPGKPPYYEVIIHTETWDEVTR